VNHESILDLITTRETAATAQAEQLREQITTLTEQLAAVETELADLATTRATLLQLTGADDDPPPADTTLASTAYQQILAVFATAESGLRAKDICHALGVGTTANHTESLRAKLKRLVTRGVLTETEPGLFTLAQPATSSPNPTPES
jgi:polyhydroxyalkanoate synthesis regulator phasin